ncbi:MAG: thioredoxin family protein [Gammaproteobacteria bacterium]
MAAEDSPLCDFGAKAHGFHLSGVDGHEWALQDCRGDKATLIMFICNHCPYVIGSIDRIVAACSELAHHGVKAVAICSNDAETYPDDSFENMRHFAKAHRFPFPYLHDESQEVARAYGAVCTPDFFGYNGHLELQYRGRLDAGRNAPPPTGARRELHDAMLEIARAGHGPKEQMASVGCSIKWKA